MISILSNVKQISKGAEATVSSAVYINQPVIVKHRFEKKYRNKALDYKLRKERSVQEVRLLQLASEHGVNVPIVLDIDKLDWIIIMEKIDGEPLKFNTGLDIHDIFAKVGIEIAKLHTREIIHGDLTTSNLMLTKTNDVFLIDFGLGYRSNHVEDRAVDLLVLKHILESSHPDISEIAFNAYIDSYVENTTYGKSVLKRMNTVEGRVRYKSH